MKHNTTKSELIKELVAAGVVGIDKPWIEMTMDERAQYAIHIDHKLVKEVDVSKIADSSIAAHLICVYPKAARGMDASMFSDEDLSTVLTAIPNKMTEVDPDRLPKLSWGLMLGKCPSLAKHCDYRWLTVVDWVLLLEKRKKFVENFEPSFIQTADEWICLLSHCPFMARFCPFDKFARKDKIRVASVSVALAKKLDLGALSVKEWSVLMLGSDRKGTSTQRQIAQELKRLNNQFRM